VTYIMGASGAGKTSLLNALCDRIGLKRGDSLTGEIRLNDRYKLTQQTYGKFGSYVMQDDILFRYFTVKEAFTFAARLKLKCSEAQQDRRINDLITELGLTACQDTPIGGIL
jgi:ABC-type multidrug transport system ATPase subunit